MSIFRFAWFRGITAQVDPEHCQSSCRLQNGLAHQDQNIRHSYIAIYCLEKPSFWVGSKREWWGRQRRLFIFANKQIGSLREAYTECFKGNDSSKEGIENRELLVIAWRTITRRSRIRPSLSYPELLQVQGYPAASLPAAPRLLPNVLFWEQSRNWTHLWVRAGAVTAWGGYGFRFEIGWFALGRDPDVGLHSTCVMKTMNFHFLSHAIRYYHFLNHVTLQ